MPLPKAVGEEQSKLLAARRFINERWLASTSLRFVAARWSAFDSVVSSRGDLFLFLKIVVSLFK